MNGFSSKSGRTVGGRAVAVILLLTAIVFTCTGTSCGDLPAASATFRDAAMSEIGAGIKLAVNGFLDGVFAVIADAGRGGSNASTSG
jgi:hypothetical protein